LSQLQAKQSRASQTTFASLIKSSPAPTLFFLLNNLPRPPRQPPPSSHATCSSSLGFIHRLFRFISPFPQAFFGSIHFTTQFNYSLFSLTITTTTALQLDLTSLDLNLATRLSPLQTVDSFSLRRSARPSSNSTLLHYQRLRHLPNLLGRNRLASPRGNATHFSNLRLTTVQDGTKKD